MDSSETRVSDRSRGGDNPVRDATQSYLKTLGDGSRTAVGHVLDEFIRECELERFDDINRDLCRVYGEYLTAETNRTDRDLSGRTAHTYYDYVRAFLSFCVGEGLLDTNPAHQNDIEKFLPGIDTQPDRQFWSVDQRETLLRHFDRQVDSALEPPRAPYEIRLERYRLRALIAVLGLTGVRGGEVFSKPRDERRNGITWTDVDIEGDTLTVRGKVKRTDRNPFEDVQLPDRAASKLAKYYEVADPPTDEWPVFPTNHYPSKRKALEREFSETRVDTMLERNAIDELLREHEVPPPAISTNGTRSVLKRISESLAPLYECIEYDSDANVYLKPHGARRGLGHELVRKGHTTVAQKSLRHGSPDVTEQSYQNVKASETAKDVTDILEQRSDER
ncbi:site-specific integrase [Natrinema versiforme]|uniref:Site-specific integrase n=1 Tax=Natrinema versiforme TaxID=88724 RepID=A0A4V1G0C2_9EURY|nr:site-specific integrase [Natrinema versiforme]QCS44836.1 site-specific integrase [Natrinema versiforme]